MLKIIHNELISGSGSLMCNVSEKILSSLEKAGMLPPLCAIEVEDVIYNDSIAHAYNLENKWEKEDD